MNIGKKIKLYSLLIIAPMSTVAQANLGTWMQEKALRGFAYLYNFLPMENNFDKKGVLCIASGTLVLTGLVSYLKAKAQSKEEKERLDEKFKYERKVANVIDSSAALVMPYIGFRLYRGMIQAENFTKDLVAPYKTDSVVYTNNRFISAQQDIMSIIAAIDIHKPKILVQPAKGNMRSSCFSGTPQGCYIEIGAEFDPHNQEHRFVLGHEAAHVKNNHHKKRAIAAFLIPAGVHTGCALLHWGAKKIISTIKHKYPMEKNSWGSRICSWIKKGTKTLSESWILKGLLSFYIFNKYMRMHEKEADIESAQLVKSAQGGIDFNKNIQSDNLKTGGLWTTGITSAGDYLFDLEHPSCSERIAYLTPLAEQQAQKVK